MRFRTECKECYSEISKRTYEKKKAAPKKEVSEKACTRCKATKPSGEFRQNPQSSDGLDFSCKTCCSTYYQSDTMKAYLLEKKTSGRQSEILTRYRTKERDAISSRKKELRLTFVRVFRAAESKVRSENRSKVHTVMGGRCVACGETESKKLCIDHVNDDGAEDRRIGTGEFRQIVGRVLRGEPWKGKYQLLCFNCNRRKQIVKVRTKDKNDRPNLTQTKCCSQCQKVLPVGLFAWSKDKPNGVSYCKPCGNMYSARRREKAFEKLGHECRICGEKDKNVLEIDHVNNDGSEKRKSGEDMNLTNRVYTGVRSVRDLQILCANCNAVKAHDHAKEKSFYIQKVPNAVVSLEDIKEFNFDEVSISEVPAKSVIEFLSKYHYIGFGRNAKKVYGAFLSGELIAVCKFSPVVRKEVATSMGIEPLQVLELDRFCIHPVYQKKNFASWFLSRCAKKIKEDVVQITRLVSFADSGQGHSGTIYKASNWMETGKTGASYVYIDAEGHVLNKKTLYGRACREFMKEREYAEKFGYSKQETPEKIKFILDVK